MLVYDLDHSMITASLSGSDVCHQTLTHCCPSLRAELVSVVLTD